MSSLFEPWAGYGGSQQYMDLFQDDSPWSKASSRVNVFKIYGYWVAKATDSQLQQQFSYLKRRHIALALEFGTMSRSEGGLGVEGFGGEALVPTVKRIMDNGGDLRYIAMDEPIYFGTIYRGHDAPRWTLDYVVADVADNLRALAAAYPNVQVGDIEPYAGQDSSDIGYYAAAMEAMNKAFGRPLAFFDLDLDWTSHGVVAKIAKMRGRIKSLGIPWGIIYDGDGDAVSSAVWLDEAEHRAADVESVTGGPDIAIFQSWHKQPDTLLPEDSPNAYTHMIDWYFLPRTKLTMKTNGRVVSGALHFRTGKPVAGARIIVTGFTPTASVIPIDITHTGTAPAGGRYIIFAVRANSEGSGTGPVDATIKSFHFDADGNTPVDRDFTNPMDPTMHIVAASGQVVMQNAKPIPISATGGYRFRVSAIITRASDNNAYCAIVFMSDKGEIQRDIIRLAQARSVLGIGSTTASGSWQVTLPTDSVHYRSLQADYAGDGRTWPAKFP